MLDEMHREDVKAALRKRFGSVAAFERAKGLPVKSVNEILRGRASARVEAAVRAALAKPFKPTRRAPSENPDSIVA